MKDHFMQTDQNSSVPLELALYFNPTELGVFGVTMATAPVLLLLSGQSRLSELLKSSSSVFGTLDQEEQDSLRPSAVLGPTLWRKHSYI
ncbi:hypothetical protein MHYP_G00092300 [Metynnis hypsauchen]